MKLRVVSGKEPWSMRVEHAETGEILEHVTKVEIVAEAGMRLPEAILHVYGIDIDVVTELKSIRMELLHTNAEEDTEG